MEFIITTPHRTSEQLNQCVDEKDLTPIEILLIKAGHKIIKDDLHSGWMKLSGVTRVLQKYHIQNNTLRTQSASKLEPSVLNYFEKRELMKLDGVKIEFKMETEERGREKLYLRFHAHDLANDGPMTKVNWEGNKNDN